MFHGLGLYYADPAHKITTAGEEIDDLEHDLSDLSEVRKHSQKRKKSKHMYP